MSGHYIRIAELIHKQRIGDITEGERRELAGWLNETEVHQKIYKEIIEKGSLETEYEKYQQVADEKVWRNIERLQEKRVAWRGVWRWSVAAVMMLFLTVGGYIFLSKQQQAEMLVTKVLTFDSIHPGKQKAILQLADGRKIIVQDKGIDLKTETVAIKQMDYGLQYTADSLPQEEKWNVLTTPRGGEFKVTLADGTRVWLNAGSSLSYPEVFVHEIRKVKLQGEAYFEVTKDKNKPFVVETGEVKVKVLGTSFNVKAFQEEGKITATLVEGSVELQSVLQCVLLKPDQQAVYSVEEGKLLVRDVESRDFMAWKEGKFVFRNEELESIMQAVSRWYNVEVFYQNPEVKTILFSGKMDRYESVEKTLKMIELTGKVRFQLGEKGLIVMAK